VLVVALRSLPGPVSPSAATPTPGVPRAHPRQRGPPHLIVAVGHLAGKIQRHAGVWGHSGETQKVGVIRR